MNARPRIVLPLEDQAFIALMKTADVLAQEVGQFLKTKELTGSQYNVLRILRGAEPEGLPCGAISGAMLTHDPDMTRLLDRMEKRGLITRQRQTSDRRVVKARITARGLALLKRLDKPISSIHKQQFRHVDPRRLKALKELLEQVGKPGTP